MVMAEAENLVQALLTGIRLPDKELYGAVDRFQHALDPERSRTKTKVTALLAFEARVPITELMATPSPIDIDMARTQQEREAALLRF